MKHTNGAIYMEQEEYDNLLKTFADEQKKKFYEEHPNAQDSDYKVTLYEMNQQLISGFAPLDEQGMKDAVKALRDYRNKNKDTTYFMLLCWDLHYFTLFTCSNNHDGWNFGGTIMDLVKDFKNVRLVEPDTNGAVAIWADDCNTEYPTEGTPHCFYLFPYDEGVINVDDPVLEQ